jgi:hypothetical protein
MSDVFMDTSPIKLSSLAKASLYVSSRPYRFMRGNDDVDLALLT